MKNKLIIFIFIIFCHSNITLGQVVFKTLTSGTTNSLLGISFEDTSTGYSCGDGGLILKTIDGGVNWKELSSGTISNLWDIKVIPGTNGKKIITVGEDNTVLKTNDGGMSWTKLSIPFATGSFVFGIQCIDSLNYIACGGDFSTFSGAVITTRDGGLSWTKTSVSSSIFLDKLFMFDSANGFIVGSNLTFEDGSIQKGVKGVFSPVKTTPNLITNLWCNDTNHITAVGLGGQIWKSSDAGSTWSDVSFNSIDLYGIQFNNPQSGFACGGHPGESIILYTNDSAKTWTKIPYFFAGVLNAICLIDNKIFICGSGGRIIKSDLPKLSDIKKYAPIKGGGNLVIFPNPTKDRFFVYNNPLGRQSTICLYDCVGKKVLSTIIDRECIEINTQSLPSGTYWYSITDNKNGHDVLTGSIKVID